MNIVCCNIDCERIENTEALLSARNNGKSETEAHDAALMGFYCEECQSWHKIENGHLLRYQYLSHQTDYYPINGVKCFIFEEDNDS